MTETVLNCGHCHKCGSKLSPVLDGEEWCDYCQTYRRYTSHGWAKNAADTQEPACPEYYGGGELIDLPPAKLAECFKDKTHQADVLFAIYRVVYPMWDEIEKVGVPDSDNKWPKCNNTTWKHIWRAFASFDEKHHPDVFKGGLWFNNLGFSVDRTADIPDFINRGALCPKGASIYQLAVNKLRLTEPMYRAPYSSEWKKVSWDWTLAEIAKRVKQTRDASFVTKNDKGQVVNHTEAIASVGSAALDNEECYLLQKMLRSWGLVYIEHQARI